MMTLITFILALICFFTLLFSIKYILKSSYYLIRHSATVYDLSKKGFLISISGLVKVGKTTISKGISHAYERDILNKLQNKLHETKVLLQKVNFNDVDKFIEDRLTDSLNNALKINFKSLAEEVLEKFELNDSLIHDFINIKRIIIVIEEYVEAYFYLYYKYNFVYSNTKHYSRITGKFNQVYDVNNQQIFNSYLKKSFDLDRYSVELIDEASDNDSAMKWREMEDTGSKEYRRKYAHIYKETNRLISIKQDSSDEVKKYRNLYHSNFYLDHKPLLRNTFSAVRKIIFKFIDFKVFIFNIKEWFKYKLKRKKNHLDNEAYGYDYEKEYNYNKSNYQRKMDTKKYYYEMFFKSCGYLVFQVKDYYKEDDIGSRSSDTFEETIMYFPVIECWGTFDHTEFSYLYDELHDVSEKQPKTANYYLHENYFERKEGDNDGGSEPNKFNFN